LEFFAFASEQWLLLSVFLLLLYAFIWRESSKGGKSISPHELTRLLNAEQAVLIDLREEKEFAAGHIAGAINIPFARIAERTADLHPHREKQLVLVDRMGQHTGSTGRTLGRQGYRISRLSGGMSEWLASKLPTVRKKCK